MIGDELVDGGVVYVVVWSGGEGLVATRETKPGLFWEPPKRLYNKRSEYWNKKPSRLSEVVVKSNVEPSVESNVESNVEGRI